MIFLIVLGMGCTFFAGFVISDVLAIRREIRAASALLDSLEAAHKEVKP